jgi:hypothetical protein
LKGCASVVDVTWRSGRTIEEGDVPEPTIGDFMSTLVAEADNPWSYINCRAHFFRYRRDVIDQSWEAEGALTIDYETYDSEPVGPFWPATSLFRRVVRVHGHLTQQMTPLPPLTLQPQPASPMEIDVRYVASTFTGALVPGVQPQTISLSVDNMNAAATLDNDHTSVNSISYITNNPNEVVVIGALDFDDGYDWFWLNFKATSRLVIKINDLHKYFQNAFDNRVETISLPQPRQ